MTGAYLFVLGEYRGLVLLAHLHVPDAELARQLDQDPDASQDVESGKIFSAPWVSTRSGSAMLDVVSVATAK